MEKAALCENGCNGQKGFGKCIVFLKQNSLQNDRSE